MRGRSRLASTQAIRLLPVAVAYTPSQCPRCSLAQTTVGDPHSVRGLRCAMTLPPGRSRSVRPRTPAIAARLPDPVGIVKTVRAFGGVAAWEVVTVCGGETCLTASEPQPATANGSSSGASRARLIGNEFPGHALAHQPGD